MDSVRKLIQKFSAVGDESTEHEESTAAPDASSDDTDSPDPADESSLQEARPSGNSDAEYESTEPAGVKEVEPEQEHAVEAGFGARVAIMKDQATQLLANIGRKVRERGITVRHLAVATTFLLAVLAAISAMPAQHAEGCGCEEHGGQANELSMEEFMQMLGVENEEQLGQLLGQPLEDDRKEDAVSKEDLSEKKATAKAAAESQEQEKDCCQNGQHWRHDWTQHIKLGEDAATQGEQHGAEPNTNDIPDVTETSAVA